MAGENRRPGPDLKSELLGQGKHFAFFQAMRLLRLVIARDGKDGGAERLADLVRVRANLALAHPSTEIDSIEEIPDSPAPYRVTANFLGLIGESSPLPVFYTEDIVNMPSDQQAQARGFLDILNFPFYSLFHRIWTKFRASIKVVEENDRRYVEILYCLAGLGLIGADEETPESFELIRYAGLLTRCARSASGLKTLLADALDEPRIDIIPCVPNWKAIPEEQRCLLGRQAHVLGEECYLGERVLDLAGKFRVRVGPLGAEEFNHFTPGEPAFERLCRLTRMYLREPLDFEIEVVLAQGEAKSAALGRDKWSRLGLDAWMLAEEHRRSLGAVYDIRPAP
jgi:type VI secretion system protein ImpH